MPRWHEGRGTKVAADSRWQLNADGGAQARLDSRQDTAHGHGAAGQWPGAWAGGFDGGYRVSALWRDAELRVYSIFPFFLFP